MTFEEWRRENLPDVNDAYSEGIARIAWNAGIDVGREACAEIARTVVNTQWASGAYEARQATQDIIDAIRARGDK